MELLFTTLKYKNIQYTTTYSCMLDTTVCSTYSQHLAFMTFPQSRLDESVLKILKLYFRTSYKHFGDFLGCKHDPL